MHIEVNTANNVHSSQNFVERLKNEVEESLNHFADRITTIELHLNDENSDKRGADDKRCMIEARLSGLQSVAVSNKADDFNLAVSGALDKLNTALDNKLGRLRDARAPIPPVIDILDAP